jgi:hypothetical protein
MNAPHSLHRRTQIEWEADSQDDRTDRVKLEDACRLVTDLVARRDALVGPDVSVIDLQAFNEAADAAEHAYADLVWLLNKQFGDEVDVELLAKALVS